MTTEIATNERTSADPDAALAQAAEALWVAVQGSPWPSLAIVPAAPGISVNELAAALATAASAQRGQDVEALDLRGRPLAESQPVVESLATPEPLYRSIVALDCPLDSQAALLFARSAGAAILAVAMGQTRSDDAEKVLELVGRSRFLGAVVQPPARK